MNVDIHLFKTRHGADGRRLWRARVSWTSEDGSKRRMHTRGAARREMALQLVEAILDREAVK